MPKLVLSRSKDRLLLTFNYIGETKISGLFFPASVNMQKSSVRGIYALLLDIAGYVCLFYFKMMYIWEFLEELLIISFHRLLKPSKRFMPYINTVNGVPNFKSEISLVSFSLTGCYMYFISDTSFKLLQISQGV